MSAEKLKHLRALIEEAQGELSETRSYMAKVSGRKKWSPIHDRLHYALIKGKDGNRRWHLVHPDAVPELESSGLDYELHDQLGGEIRSGTEMLSGTARPFMANRVHSMTMEHPELGPTVVKGREGHGKIEPPTTAPTREVLTHTQVEGKPPRSLRFSEKPDPRAEGKARLNLHTDLAPYEQKLREKMNMEPLTPAQGLGPGNYLKKVTPPPTVTGVSTQLDRSYDDEQQMFGDNAEWFTEAAQVSGAPVVPLYVGEIGEAAEEANAAAPMYDYGDWYKHPEQYASFQPHISTPEEAAKQIGREHMPLGWLKNEEHKDWGERLEHRLYAAEKAAGAPDCHEGNTIDVPTLVPGGYVTGISHGIDYEYHPTDGGIMSGDDENAYELMEPLERPLSENAIPQAKGELDVVGTLAHWPEHNRDPYASEVLSRIYDAWHDDENADKYLKESLLKVKENHKKLKARDITQAEHLDPAVIQ